MSIISVIPPVEIRIIVRNDEGSNIDNIIGYIIGNSGKGETYDDTKFNAPSWVVFLPLDIVQYPELVRDIFNTISFEDRPNMIKIIKGSKLEPDHVEIADEDHYRFFLDGVKRNGGTKKRRRMHRSRKRSVNKRSKLSKRKSGNKRRKKA